MTDFGLLSEIITGLGEELAPAGKRLRHLGLLSGGRPTLRALVRGIAKKIPYGNREGRVSHAYRWSPDRLKVYLREEDE